MIQEKLGSIKEPLLRSILNNNDIYVTSIMKYNDQFVVRNNSEISET